MAKIKKIRPDHVEQIGPLLYSRYGQIETIQSSWDKKSHAKFKENLLRNYPILRKEIDENIIEITKIVNNYKPLPLLYVAYNYMALTNSSHKSEVEISIEQIIPMQLLLYIQNIVVSNFPSGNQDEYIDQIEYERLQDLFKKMYFNIYFYHMCCVEKEREEGNYDNASEEMKFSARLIYNNVWGKNYQSLELGVLDKLLVPHASIFEKHFQVTVEDFIGSIKKICESLTVGLKKAYIECDDLIERCFNEVESLAGSDIYKSSSPYDLIQAALHKNNRQKTLNEIRNKIIGGDLFDLQKITSLPINLLEALSLAPGEDQLFMSKDEPYGGWPSKILPSRYKPFIKFDERYYCFHLYNFIDNIYRTLYKLIINLDPSYKEPWNKNQSKAVENYTFELFSKLLPDSEIYQNIFYGNKKKRAETDNIICFDDNLFIVEIKAGSFSPYSPTTDFKGFQRSIDNLIRAPHCQGKRLLKYFEENKDGAKLFDRQGKVIKEIRLSDYRCTSILCVTLEQLMNSGASFVDLKSVEINLCTDKYPTWLISIDDLCVYADLCRSPLIFCHYLEKRNEALRRYGHLVFDELDHYGAYIKHNNYADHFPKNSEFSKFNLYGYKAIVDNYYHSLLIEKPIPIPIQDIPPLLVQITNLLNHQKKAGRCRVVSCLLNISIQERYHLADEIMGILVIQNKTRTPKIINMYGQTKLSITLEQDNVRLEAKLDSEKEALASMVTSNDEYRHLIQLKFNKSDELYDVSYIFLTKSFINVANEAVIREMASAQINARLRNYLKTHKKIRRNKLCPCASGKKYKKCHGSLE